MKKKLIIIGAILIVIISGVLIGIVVNSNKIPSNYYAKLSSETEEKAEYIYLYIEGEKTSYIKTSAISEDGKYKSEKIVKQDDLDYPQDILIIAAELKTFYFITLNVDVQNSSQNKKYKKGDKITINELWKLIAKN